MNTVAMYVPAKKATPHLPSARTLDACHIVSSATRKMNRDATPANANVVDGNAECIVNTAT